MHIDARRVDWPFTSPFHISYETRTRAETLLVEISDVDVRGRGEAVGLSYHHETADSILRQVNLLTAAETGRLSRETLSEQLPAGGARNALDCALWDLESKRSGRRAWELAGLTTIRPLQTAYTLGVDSPEAMGLVAGRLKHYPILKLKLAGESDVERVTAVRRARPDAQILVDANQAWTEAQLREFVPQLAFLDVRLIEQPLPVGKDHLLAEFRSSIPFCADESCQTTESLQDIVEKYRYINIKLDKTGGLTEALRLTHAARAAGLGLMVGCMAGSSLAMAPAFIIGQYCSVVDLDAPLLQISDVANAIRYEGASMAPPTAALWG